MTHKPAPGSLEVLREYLNTWSIPNDTRKPAEAIRTQQDLTDFLDQQPLLKDLQGNVEEFKAFREDVRKSIETQEIDVLSPWMQYHPLYTVFVKEERAAKIMFKPEDEDKFVGIFLAIIAEVVSKGQWNRLKSCPDCRYVFYDHSKNGSKKWCSMYAGGSNGRACGTIDKVKRYRSRNQIST
ncbi:CGNR zinc finger domain-containing protein [Metabacillus sp. FJAT-52054]|uniref:CGNR zinc finger domain-containing protein n=1 Tax=Metabacillus sediminis TaxID=3117746 RepID=A0ABZ2NJR6_9BACI